MTVRTKVMAILALAAVVVTSAACSNATASEVRAHFGDSTISPDQVNRLSFSPKGYLGMVIDSEGYTYVQGTADDPDSQDNLWRIYRKSPDGEWNVIIERREDVSDLIKLRGRPGTLEAYASSCHFSLLVEDLTVEDIEPGPFRLYRITENDGLLDVSGAYWGGMSPETLADLGISDCSASWAMHPDGALLLATRNTLWEVSEGHAEVVLENLPDVLKVDERYRASNVQRPKIRVSKDGDLLLYYRELSCPQLPPRTRPLAALVSGNRVEHIPLNECEGYIEDAAIGPDGAAYFIFYDYQFDETGSGLFRGMRGTVDQQSEFLQGIESGYGIGVQAVSFDAEGKMYLIHGNSGGGFMDPEWWLLRFPIETVLRE